MCIPAELFDNIECWSRSLILMIASCRCSMAICRLGKFRQGELRSETAELRMAEAYTATIKLYEITNDRKAKSRSFVLIAPPLPDIEDDFPGLRRKTWTIILDDDPDEAGRVVVVKPDATLALACLQALSRGWSGSRSGPQLRRRPSRQAGSRCRCAGRDQRANGQAPA